MKMKILNIRKIKIIIKIFKIKQNKMKKYKISQMIFNKKIKINKKK